MSTFNQILYMGKVQKVTFNDHDRKFLCNKLAKEYQKLERRSENIDKLLIWKQGEPDLTNDWCCGIHKVTLTNPKTRNTFHAAFNHGH